MSDSEVAITADNEAGSWEGILAPDEEILWQGAPLQSLRWEIRTPQAAFDLLAFAAFITAPVLLFLGDPSVFLGALIFLGSSTVLVIAKHALALSDRRRTFYSVTSKRAFIATRYHRSKQLMAYPLDETSVLRLVDTEPGDVFFAREIHKSKNEDTGALEISYKFIGFETITQPRKVFDLMVSLGGRDK